MQISLKTVQDAKMAFSLSSIGNVSRINFIVLGESYTLLKMKENLNRIEVIEDIQPIQSLIIQEKS